MIDQHDSTWRQAVSTEMRRHGDRWENLVALTPTDFKLNDEMTVYLADDGGEYPGALTLWTKTRVYFAVTFDGFTGISSVPRNPCDEIVKIEQP